MKTSALIMLMCLVLLSLATYPQQQENAQMPVTSPSEKAVELYHQSISAMENAESSRAAQLMNEALEEDPGLFMAYVQMALMDLYRNNQKSAGVNLYRAVTCPRELSEAENLIKTALAQLQENPEADVREVGEKLTRMYPDDKISWYILAGFQNLNKDYDGALNSYRKLADIMEDPGPAYNMIGYTFLQKGNLKEAEQAFDRYIELNPSHPNPYDSKGDYYMAAGQYNKAFKSYMKAYNMDSVWSYNKAMKARELAGEQAMEIESPDIRGAWKLVAARWLGDSLRYEMPGNAMVDQVKLWTDKNYSCIGKYGLKSDQEQKYNYSAGEYRLLGKHYDETIQYHSDPNAEGNNAPMIIQLKGDTLIQMWPADHTGKVDQKSCWIEKYVRLE